MAEDEPPDARSEAKRKAHAKRHGIPDGQVKHFSLSPWEWAAARGMKPLPGREIPPEYRHLFETPGGVGPEAAAKPAAAVLEPDSSRPSAPAESTRIEEPLSGAEERIYQAMVRREWIRRALAREDLPVA